MPLPWSLANSHRFLEILAMIILTAPPLTYPTAFAHLLVDPTLVIHTVVTMVLAIALVFERFQGPSRWLLVATGLYTVTMRPEAVEGVPLFLLGVYLCYQAEWSRRQTWTFVLVLGSLLAIAQAASFFVGAERVIEPMRWLVVDLLIALLVFAFRRDLFPQALPPRPELMLPDFDLTARETQIVHLIWGGETPKQIAHSLGILDATVRKDLSSLYGKMGVEGLKELSHLIHTHEIVWERPVKKEEPPPFPHKRFRI